jgi:hypothetical protein
MDTLSTVSNIIGTIHNRDIFNQGLVFKLILLIIHNRINNSCSEELKLISK